MVHFFTFLASSWLNSLLMICNRWNNKNEFTWYFTENFRVFFRRVSAKSFSVFCANFLTSSKNFSLYAYICEPRRSDGSFFRKPRRKTWKKTSVKKLPEISSQHYLGKTFWILSCLRNFPVLLELKVFSQGSIETGIPSKHLARNLLQKNSRNFFKIFLLTNFFCRNFSKCCKSNYIFGAFALKSTSPRACVGWWIK